MSEIRVNNVIADNGLDAVNFAKGINVSSGIITATSFSGSGDTNTKITFPAADTITAETGGTERLRITSDGKMGLGIASPTGQFAVSDGTRIAEINPHSSGTFIGNRSNHDVLFQVNAATKAKIDTNGHLTISDGNLIVASGHGIDFSATPANAGRTTTQELLDDYEEGTFTASMQGGSNSGSFSGSQQSRYVKIGKQVTCWIMIHGDLSGASGNLEWTGFPFTSENPQEAVGSLQFNNMRGGMPSGTNTVHALMHPSLTKVHFRCNADGNNTAYTALSSSTNYGFTYARLVITYTTAS